MLQVTGLRKSFGPVVAVDGVSLSLGPGEILGLLDMTLGRLDRAQHAAHLTTSTPVIACQVIAHAVPGLRPLRHAQ